MFVFFLLCGTINGRPPLSHEKNRLLGDHEIIQRVIAEKSNVLFGVVKTKDAEVVLPAQALISEQIEKLP